MLVRLMSCKGGDRFDEYLVLDQEETRNLLSEGVDEIFGDKVLVVHMGDGEIVGMDGNLEVQLKEVIPYGP